MTTNTQWLRQRITAGVDTTPIGDKTQGLDAMLKSQVSAEFRSLCDNRMLMGAFRYGMVKDQAKGSRNNVGSMITRLKLYQQTGNLEHLVDVANIAMVEFITGDHPNRHFEAADDGIHVESTLDK